MHTVELLEAAIAAIKGLGYRVRIEPLDGGEGGICVFQKRRWLFLDAAAPPVEQLHHVLEVLREYTDATGKALTQIKMGQQVDVRLKFRGLKGDYIGNVALVDLLPGGFELVVPTQAADTPFAEAAVEEDEEYGGRGTYSGWQCQVCVSQKAMLEYADMREDRVVFYVAANRDVQEIVYRIKATNVGTYNVPPAYGEAMYDRSVIAR